MPGPPAAVSESLSWLCVVGLGRAARACRVRRRRYLARVAHSICRTSRTKRTSRCVLQFWIAPRTAVASLRPFRKREARSAEARPDRTRCGYVKTSEVVPRSFHLAATRSRRASRVLSSRQEFQRVPSFSIGGTSARLPQHRCKVLGTWREATERRRSAVGDLSSSGRYPGNLPHPADTRSPKPRSTILRRQE